MSEKNMTTTIYVMTHKAAVFPSDPVYHPLHVGRAVSLDLGYPGDNTGDNISAKNNRYGELTGLYWMWKNSPEQGLIGLCHYRRFFLDDRGEILKGKAYARILEQADVIVSKEMDAGKPYIDYYNEAHDPNQQRLVREAIEVLFPADLAIYDDTMRARSYHYGNLCVMRRALLNDYCEWLFTILHYVEERLDLRGYDEYHARVYGFLSEQLLKVWIQKKGLKVYACPIGITTEKAETKEFKQAMAQLVKMGQFSEARQMFGEILKIRPDIALELSDLKGEVPVIECVLYVLETEASQGLKQGMYQYSAVLPELIEHYRKLSQIVSKREEHTKESREYMKRTHVTDVALSIVRQNPRV